MPPPPLTRTRRARRASASPGWDAAGPPGRRCSPSPMDPSGCSSRNRRGRRARKGAPRPSPRPSRWPRSAAAGSPRTGAPGVRSPPRHGSLSRRSARQCVPLPSLGDGAGPGRRGKRRQYRSGRTGSSGTASGVGPRSTRSSRLPGQRAERRPRRRVPAATAAPRRGAGTETRTVAGAAAKIASVIASPSTGPSPTSRSR